MMALLVYASRCFPVDNRNRLNKVHGDFSVDLRFMGLGISDVFKIFREKVVKYLLFMVFIFRISPNHTIDFIAPLSMELPTPPQQTHVANLM